jgi:hypothetical protein
LAIGGWVIANYTGNGARLPPAELKAALSPASHDWLAAGARMASHIKLPAETRASPGRTAF